MEFLISSSLFQTSSIAPKLGQGTESSGHFPDEDHHYLNHPSPNKGCSFDLAKFHEFHGIHAETAISAKKNTKQSNLTWLHGNTLVCIYSSIISDIILLPTSTSKLLEVFSARLPLVKGVASIGKVQLSPSPYERIC